jgi:hypothetical protein
MTVCALCLYSAMTCFRGSFTTGGLEMGAIVRVSRPP